MIPASGNERLSLEPAGKMREICRNQQENIEISETWKQYSALDLFGFAC